MVCSHVIFSLLSINLFIGHFTMISIYYLVKYLWVMTHNNHSAVIQKLFMHYTYSCFDYQACLNLGNQGGVFLPSPPIHYWNQKAHLKIKKKILTFKITKRKEKWMGGVAECRWKIILIKKLCKHHTFMQIVKHFICIDSSVRIHVLYNRMTLHIHKTKRFCQKDGGCE